MMVRRQYEDSCGMAQGLNVVGERWSLLVVRELLLGPKRFSRLRNDLPGISADVLSRRLEELESNGVLQRRKLDPPADVWVYTLTEWGAGLEPIIIQLGHWGAQSPSFDIGHGMSATSVVLSQRTMFHPEAAAGARLRIDLVLEGQRFSAEVADEQLTITPGGAPDADATIAADPVTLASILFAGRGITDALDAQRAHVTGDVSAVEQYASMFRLPPTAE